MSSPTNPFFHLKMRGTLNRSRSTIIKPEPVRSDETFPNRILRSPTKQAPKKLKSLPPKIPREKSAFGRLKTLAEKLKVLQPFKKRKDHASSSNAGPSIFMLETEERCGEPIRISKITSNIQTVAPSESLSLSKLLKQFEIELHKRTGKK